MADVNVLEHNSLMVTPTIKSNAGAKVCEKKNQKIVCLVQKSLVMSNRPSDGFFYQHLSLMNSYK